MQKRKDHLLFVVSTNIVLLDKTKAFASHQMLKKHYKTIPHYWCNDKCGVCIIYGKPAIPKVPKFGCRHNKCQQKFHDFKDKYQQKEHEELPHTLCKERTDICVSNNYSIGTCCFCGCVVCASNQRESTNGPSVISTPCISIPSNSIGLF